jgi:hypothetical protein
MCVQCVHSGISGAWVRLSPPHDLPNRQLAAGGLHVSCPWCSFSKPPSGTLLPGNRGVLCAPPGVLAYVLSRAVQKRMLQCNSLQLAPTGIARLYEYVVSLICTVAALHAAACPAALLPLLLPAGTLV